MEISVLSPDENLYSGSIRSVKVPGISGQFEILNNHAPIVSVLSPGQVRIITSDGETIGYKIETGFVEVLDNRVSLLITGATKV